MELLESSFVRPRQARYQAALRPDMKYVMIIKHFPTELLLHRTNSASLNGIRTAGVERRLTVQPEAIVS
jgi:hypothetical protein